LLSINFTGDPPGNSAVAIEKDGERQSPFWGMSAR
jgi:hypothetical protein